MGGYRVVTNSHSPVKVKKVACKCCGRLFLSRKIAEQHPQYCAPVEEKAAYLKGVKF